MPLNRAYLGRVIQPVFSHRVSEEALIAFADAVGEHHPACRDAGAAVRLGHRTIVAVPTYAAAVALRAERPLFDDPGFGADTGSLRHREAGIAFHRPVYAGDVLRCTVRVASIERVGASEVLTTVTTIEAEGEPVAVVRSTVVVAGA